MSYRKLVVNEKEYEYVIGRTYVKVKGIGSWLKEDVGTISMSNFRKNIECPPCDPDYFDQIQVKPSQIADKIKLYEKMKGAFA